MYVHGGYNESIFYDNFYCLNINDYNWKLITNNDNVFPKARGGHCLISVNKGLFLFGGG